MPRTVGIHFGVTDSMVAVMDGDTPVIIEHEQVFRSTPSIVTFQVDGNPLVGNDAEILAEINQELTATWVQRQIDTSQTVNILGKRYEPEELSSLVLRKLKDDAEAYLNDSVSGAVITVPGHFDDAAREATVQAADMAGLTVIELLDEPVAAALACELGQGSSNDTILVCNLDRKKFDVSVLRAGKGAYEVESSIGGLSPGSEDWDQCIAEWVIQRFKSLQGIDLSANPYVGSSAWAARQSRLMSAAKEARNKLVVESSVNLELPAIVGYTSDLREHRYTLSRTEFDELTFYLLDWCRDNIQMAVDDADISAAEVDHVILVGEAASILAVRELIEEVTGTEVSISVDPEEVVVIGAATRSTAFVPTRTVDETAELSDEARRLVDRVRSLNSYAIPRTGVGIVGPLQASIAVVERALGSGETQELESAVAALNAALERVPLLPHEPIRSSAQGTQG